ncbi:PAS domain S-box-containing protein [Halopenitus malekzadehii]|uniref:histidine kinase n=1 Tax=Halopenitus malekzadehii TaxID=1267564 RepID=A0A1H6JSI5_9EURY|nr:PAS domain S-box protein [Halopenitus malekzadehii]SEH65214.1 PAS domain S-box-containing protein [Halopenitus malekzadehii]
MELTRDQYQELVRTLADGILVVDVSGEILYESPAVQRLTGYAPEERTGDHVFEHVHPKDRERVREAFADVLEFETETVVTAEFRFRHADGSWIWLEARGRTQRATTIGGYIVRISDVTEAKAREERLERTTASFEALFENSPDMIDIHTADGTIVDVNRQFCAAFDQPKAEIVGRKVWEIDQEIEPDELRAIWERMDVGERTEVETVFETGDGTRFPVEVHLTRLHVNDGDRFVVISRDITERKQQLREIRSLKNRLELAVEGATLGVWDWDMRTDAVEFNDQWAEMLGYDLDDLEPHLDTWETRVHPDDIDAVTDALDAHRNGETDHYDTTHRMRTADGEWKWIRDLGRIVERDADGEPIRAVGIHLDVDDAKRDQRELERKTQELERKTQELEDLTTRLEEQYRTLFEEAPVMAVVTRAEDGRPIIEDCNNQFADTLGVEPDALVGTDLAECYTTDSERALIDDGGYEDALNGAFTNESRDLVAADGNVIETRLRAVPQKDADGEVGGTLAMYIDVTERETVKRANERLEEFASIVSHDLRNPLNVAMGHLELAREDCESPHLEAVQRAHDRMEALIEDLLTLARQGEAVAETDAVDLAAVVEACWETVETADATLVVADDRTVVADETRLRQLFENLIRNAVEHSSTSPRSHACGDAVEHGGPDVTVTVGGLEDGFFVADDGPGIPDDDAAAVFEAGYSTNAEGTGFGLSIVQRIAEAHGWDVTVTSGSDGGARFEFTGVEFAAE